MICAFVAQKYKKFSLTSTIFFTSSKLPFFTAQTSLSLLMSYSVIQSVFRSKAFCTMSTCQIFARVTLHSNNFVRLFMQIRNITEFAIGIIIHSCCSAFSDWYWVPVRPFQTLTGKLKPVALIIRQFI